MKKTVSFQVAELPFEYSGESILQFLKNEGVDELNVLHDEYQELYFLEADEDFTVLMETHCGYSSGCFWTMPQEVIGACYHFDYYFGSLEG